MHVCVFSCMFNGVCPPQCGVCVRTREPSETTALFPGFQASSSLNPVEAYLWNPLIITIIIIITFIIIIIIISYIQFLQFTDWWMRHHKVWVCLDKMWFICRPEHDTGASCDSVCWQLNQRGLDEWPANHCQHSVAIAIAHRELSLGFSEEQTSHNLILKSICLLVSIWLPPTLSLSLCTFYFSHCQLFWAAHDLLYTQWKTTCPLPPLFPSFICNGGRRQLLCMDCCNLRVGYFHFSFVNNSPLLQHNYFPPCSNNNMLNGITHITLSHDILNNNAVYHWIFYMIW